MKERFILLLALAVTSTHAGIYKCVVDGKTRYSQRPCGGGEKEIAVIASTRSQIYTPQEEGLSRFYRFLAVAEVAQKKGKDCEWDIRETGAHDRCKEFADYINAYGAFGQLAGDAKKTNWLKHAERIGASNLLRLAKTLKEIKRLRALLEEHYR